ncbi:MAG TPA: hypothetical protein VGL65_11100 [Gemmatimonadales bacterium]|jgi:hypothetical protein
MRTFLVLGLIGVGGCQMETTASCSAVPPIVGRWSYTATESSPVHANLSGTLSITSASCDGIVGSMDVLESDAAGGQQRLAGPITGQVVDGKSFQFSAFIDATPRQHLASVTGDSVSGSWVEAAGSASASGTFGGRKE